MTAPRRVQVKAIGTWPRFTGIGVPEGAVYVGREMYGHPGSPYANPYKPSAKTREAYTRCVAVYRAWLLTQPELVKRARDELAGRDLACWCHRKTWPCHADVLLELVNSPCVLC
jgi:glutaminase